jgi:hypothetical protein
MMSKFWKAGFFGLAALCALFSGAPAVSAGADDVAPHILANPKIAHWSSPHWEGLKQLNYWGNWQSRQFDFLDAWGERFQDAEVVSEHGFSQLAAYYDSFIPNIEDFKRTEIAEAWRSVHQDWLKHNPKSAVPHLVQARQTWQLALNFRGSGYASQVARRDMAEYDRLLAEARQTLLNCESICNKQPYWYYLMYDIESRQGIDREPVMARLLEGIKKFPKAYILYVSAVDFMLPEWGGSVVEIKAWVKFALANTQADVGDELYARIYGYYARYPTLNKWSDYPQAHWDRLISATRYYVAKYPTEYNYLRFVHVACSARNQAEVEKNWRLMAEMRTPPGDPEVNAAEYCRWQQVPKVDLPVLPSYPSNDGARKAKSP